MCHFLTLSTGRNSYPEATHPKLCNSSWQHCLWHTKNVPTTVACLPACLSAWPSSSQRDRKSKQSLHITTLCSQLEPATRSDCPCFNLKIPCLHPGRAACMHLPAQVPPSISSVVLLQSCISVAFLTIMKWQWYTQCLFYASLFNSIFQIKPLLNLSSIIFNLHPFHSHRFLKKRNCGKTRAQCTAHKITLALCVWSTDFTRR